MLLGVELDVVFPFAFLDAIHSSVYFRSHTVVLVLWQTCRPASSLFSYVRNRGSIMPFNWHLIPRVLMTVGYPIGHVHNVHATGGSQTHCCSPIRRWWWFTSARERRQKHIRPSKTRTHSDGQNNLLRHVKLTPFYTHLCCLSYPLRTQVSRLRYIDCWMRSICLCVSNLQSGVCIWTTMER